MKGRFYFKSETEEEYILNRDLFLKKILEHIDYYRHKLLVNQDELARRLFIMKIDEKFIDNIFNYKIKLKNKADKIKLSLYTDIIPMYDIYNQEIYQIKKEDTYNYLTKLHYRFINDEVKEWIITKYKKYSNKLINWGKCFLSDINSGKYIIN